MSIVGREECQDLCNQVSTCAAFTIDRDGHECQLATACMGSSRAQGLTTYVKPVTHAPAKGHARAAGAAGQGQNAAAGRVAARSPLAAARRRGGKGPATLPAAVGHLETECSYCPPQNPCEGPRMCRSGQCFSNLPLPDDTPCPGGTCRRGMCLGAGVPVRPGRTMLEARGAQAASSGAGSVRTDAEGGERDVLRAAGIGTNADALLRPLERETGGESPLDAFELVQGRTCLPEMTVSSISSTLGRCATACLEDVRCHAFSLRLDALRQCVLFGAGADCSVEETSFLTGVRRPAA